MGRGGVPPSKPRHLSFLSVKIFAATVWGTVQPYAICRSLPFNSEIVASLEGGKSIRALRPGASVHAP